MTLRDSNGVELKRGDKVKYFSAFNVSELCNGLNGNFSNKTTVKEHFKVYSNKLDFPCEAEEYDYDLFVEGIAPIANDEDQNGVIDLNQSVKLKELNEFEGSWVVLKED